jgi:hypothetical protein
MNDEPTTVPTTDPGYSEAQIAAAQDREKVLLGRLNALPYGSPAAEDLVNQIGDNAKVAYADPPVQWSADGPSAEVRAAARPRLPQNNEELKAATPGTARHMELIDERIALLRVADAPGAHPLSGLPWDVEQAPLPDPAPAAPPAVLPQIPRLGGTTQWRLDALKEAQSVADKDGHALQMPSLLAVIARVHREGVAWNSDKLLQHWQERYAPEQVELLQQAERTFEATVLSRAGKFAAQLQYLDAYHHPEVVERALRAWALWPL